MSQRRLTRLTRHRHLVITATAGVAAALTAILMVGAPPIPAVVGIALAVMWLLWRAPKE